MKAAEIRSIEIIDDAVPMQFVEVLETTHIDRAFLIELVDAGVVSPAGAAVEQWQFARGDVRRLRRAQRLMADLQVNSSGAALILDLIEEREALLRRLRVLSGLVDDA